MVKLVSAVGWVDKPSIRSRPSWVSAKAPSQPTTLDLLLVPLRLLAHNVVPERCLQAVGK
jgi:hypothetical protein